MKTKFSARVHPRINTHYYEIPIQKRSFGWKFQFSRYCVMRHSVEQEKYIPINYIKYIPWRGPPIVTSDQCDVDT